MEMEKEMELEITLRAIDFAPVSMLVLAPDGSIKRMSLENDG